MSESDVQAAPEEGSIKKTVLASVIGSVVEWYDFFLYATMAALVFNQPLKPEQVDRQGITAVSFEAVQQAELEGKRIKLIATLQRSDNGLEANVAPRVLPLDDPLARVGGVTNALTIQADTLSEVTITGPGAGGLATAQGLLADVIACAR